MRFFTTVTPAGRLEYFIVGLIINVAVAVAIIGLFELRVDPLSQEVSYAVDKLAVMAFIYVGFLALAIINVLRRMKDIGMGSAWILLLFVPLVNILFQLQLLFSSGIKTATYTPYGDDPYDPNSWVPPATSSGTGTPAVTFRGQALTLPGEDSWEDNAA